MLKETHPFASELLTFTSNQLLIEDNQTIEYSGSKKDTDDSHIKLLNFFSFIDHSLSQMVTNPINEKNAYLFEKLLYERNTICLNIFPPKMTSIDIKNKFIKEAEAIVNGYKNVSLPLFLMAKKLLHSKINVNDVSEEDLYNDWEQFAFLHSLEKLYELKHYSKQEIEKRLEVASNHLEK